MFLLIWGLLHVYCSLQPSISAASMRVSGIVWMDAGCVALVPGLSVTSMTILDFLRKSPFVNKDALCIPQEKSVALFLAVDYFGHHQATLTTVDLPYVIKRGADGLSQPPNSWWYPKIAATTSQSPFPQFLNMPQYILASTEKQGPHCHYSLGGTLPFCNSLQMSFLLMCLCLPHRVWSWSPLPSALFKPEQFWM